MASGEPRELGSAVKLALYRVTQEALTNVRKHARPAGVAVRLAYQETDVNLLVEDFADSSLEAGEGAEPDWCGGYGLTGMRERAEVLGGTLTAGRTGRGFLVALRVPA
jgi:signal transduction histidine kinase